MDKIENKTANANDFGKRYKKNNSNNNEPPPPQPTIKEPEQSINNKSLLLCKSMNEWIEEAKNKPIPKMLFDELWWEGELCVLYSDTNLGKSILANQIANSITSGIPIKGFRLEAGKQPVLYFDFELSEKQLENRCSQNYENHYLFNDTFHRCAMNPDFIPSDEISIEDYLNNEIEQQIISKKAKILIIDNITYLKSESTEKAKDALPLMKHLKKLKNKYQLSILILAHTPKRDESQSISLNHLAGSSMFKNFFDSGFAIGKSQLDKDIRYIKQMKERVKGFIYDAENVITCQINKEFNFVCFEFLNYSKEFEHLKQYSENDRSDLIEQVNQLRQQGKSIRVIADELDINKSKVERILKNKGTVSTVSTVFSETSETSETKQISL